MIRIAPGDARTMPGPCGARKQDSACGLQIFRPSGCVHVLVDQAVENGFPADLPCVDVGHRGVGNAAFVAGNVLRDALVGPARCPRAGNRRRGSRRPGRVGTAARLGPRGAVPDRCPWYAGFPRRQMARPSRRASSVRRGSGDIPTADSPSPGETWRRSTAFSCRSTNSSASFARSRRNMRAARLSIRRSSK